MLAPALKVLITLVLAALVFAAPAQANAPRNWERAALATANRVWGPQTCGALSIQWAQPADFGGTELWGGWAYTGECVIYEPADRVWLGYPDFCTAVLHEAGHVAGREHAARGIMRAERTVARSSGRERGRRVVHWGDVDPRCLRARDH
jgi:hypothetical protein